MKYLVNKMATNGQIIDFYLHNTGKLNFGDKNENPTVYLEGVSIGAGGVCVSTNLIVSGNVFSEMGVCDASSAPPGTYQISPTEFVNGVVFPPYQSAEESQHFVVRVPGVSQIQASFPEINPNQTFDTIIYGTSLGSSPAIGMSFPSDITVLESTDGKVIFDRRLVSDKGISGGLSFHFAEATLQYYQGVVIRSRMGTVGVSMYPYATSFYTC